MTNATCGRPYGYASHGGAWRDPGWPALSFNEQRRRVDAAPVGMVISLPLPTSTAPLHPVMPGLHVGMSQ